MKLKSKKWYYRSSYHMLGYDVNTWLLDETIQLLGKDNIFVPLPQFKMIAWELCNRGSKRAP